MLFISEIKYDKILTKMQKCVGGVTVNITVCIGSSCHLKGSRQIVKKLQELVEKEALQDKVELNGSFCMGQCVNGVCVKLDNEIFNDEVLRRLT